MSQGIVTIKGTRKGLIILLDGNCDLGELKKALTAKFVAAQGFFRGARFILSPSRPLSLKETAELEELCRHHGLVPATEREHPPALRLEGPSVELAPPVELPTFLQELTLRSGQELTVEGNIVLLGHVHPGATIKASGSIFIIGSLSGVAHAGYLGDEAAIILAYRMQPSQLRIADATARSPGKVEPRPYPEIARLVAGRITLEPYRSIYNTGENVVHVPPAISSTPPRKLGSKDNSTLGRWEVGYES